MLNIDQTPTYDQAMAQGWLGPGLATTRRKPAERTETSPLDSGVPTHPPEGIRTPGYEISKRLIDIVIATALLVVLFPLLVGVALAVMFTSRGPIFFKQLRRGRYGKEFWCYKFRTMVADAEAQLKQNEDLRRQYETNFKIRNDPRVTRVGAFLRRSSLDELPQLWNVFKGDMSLIGPRPLVGPELSTHYGPATDKLLLTKPGLGCFWQVSGRSNTTWEEHVELDLLYVDSRSLKLDIHLLLLTAVAVCKRRGAY